MKRLFTEMVKNRGLKTEAGALRRAEKFKELMELHHIPLMIIVEDGRYAPVVFLRKENQHFMLTFAEGGVGVIG